MSNEKPTIVLLHGWGGSASSWERNITFLKDKGYPCIALKMPGFDLPEPDPLWGVPEYAEFVVREIKSRLGGGRCVLVGHSFGGRLAINIASSHPELVEKLVLTDSAGLNLEPKFLRALMISLSKFFQKLEEIFKPLSALRGLGIKLLGSRNYKSATPVMREVLKKVANLDLSFCLPNIRCKTLIVWGEKDTTTPMVMAETFRKRITNSRLVVIPNAAHNANYTNAKEWNERVIEFLSSD